MSLCNAIINLLSLAKDKEEKNHFWKVAQQEELYSFMHDLIFISCLSVIGKLCEHKELHLLKTSPGVVTSDIIY